MSQPPDKSSLYAISKTDLRALPIATLGPTRSIWVFTRAKVFGKTPSQFVHKRSTKRAPNSAPFCISLKPLSRRMLPKRLTLGELERPARLGLAVLLALDDAGIAGEKAALLEHAAQLRLEIGERLGDAVTDGARL